MTDNSDLLYADAVRIGASAATKKALFVQFGAVARDTLVDEMPVDLAFALLSPTDAGADHLKALARVSRRLRDPGFTAKLRGAGSPDALWALWAEAGARSAA